jgi:hypothetical protein
VQVHAVYPTILQEKLVRMSVDQIIAKDSSKSSFVHSFSALLTKNCSGTQRSPKYGYYENIVAPDSKTFAKEIGKYIDSKDQKRGKKDKGKENQKKVDSNAPALWPLIRQVRVRCPSAALSTGAVLVDLPGVAGANVARNNIAKSYMKKVLFP